MFLIRIKTKNYRKVREMRTFLRIQKTNYNYLKARRCTSNLIQLVSCCPPTSDVLSRDPYPTGGALSV